MQRQLEHFGKTWRKNMKHTQRYFLIACGAFLLGSLLNLNIYNGGEQINCNICFTPGQPCTQRIVDEIRSAKKEILVQSYSFTSIEIAEALVDAHNRGVNVRCIVDSSQEGKIIIVKLAASGINVYIDKPAGIAHNKVMIIDNACVLTGSFNFTKAAQMRNVENSIIIRNGKIAKQYKRQWQKRLELSKKFVPVIYYT